MKLTSQMVKDYGKSRGLDLVGVANIDRFAECPRRMHPASIFPECRSVIVAARRIVRGGWRGIEEGTHWPSYTYFNYHGLLNTFFLQMPLYELACFVEDHGWEAVPYYPGGPEKQPDAMPLRQGGVAPEVELSIRLAGVAAGLGEMGWSKIFMSRELGPRQRLAAIFTDAELEPDPLVEAGQHLHALHALRGGVSVQGHSAHQGQQDRPGPHRGQGVRVGRRAYGQMRTLLSRRGPDGLALHGDGTSGLHLGRARTGCQPGNRLQVRLDDEHRDVAKVRRSRLRAS